MSDRLGGVRGSGEWVAWKARGELCDGVSAGPRKLLQAVHSEDGAHSCWFSGSLFGHSLASDAARFLKTYLDDGLNAVGQLAGKFSAIVQDHQADKLLVITDRLGLMPLYVVERARSLHFARTLKSLCLTGITECELSLEAVAELLTFKYILGHGTLLRDIERVPAACVIKIDLSTGNREQRTYWRPEDVLEGPKRKMADMEERLIDTFRSGVRALTAGGSRVGLSLSGGMDSRAVLAAMRSLNVNMKAFTGGIEDGHDHVYAAMICQQLGIRHEFLAMDDAFRRSFWGLMAEVAERVEGMLLTDGTGIRWQIRHASDEHPRVVLHGALGELARLQKAHSYYVDRSLGSASSGSLAGRLVARFANVHDRMLALLAPELRQKLAGLALEKFRDVARGLAGRLRPLDAVSALLISEQFRHSGAYSFQTWGDRFDVASPFGDPAYLEALLSVRGEDRVNSSFHHRLIRRLCPELMQFPESNTGCRPDASRLRAALSGGYRRLLSRIGSRRTKGHSDYATWMNELDPSPTEFLLSRDTAWHALLDPDAVKQRIASAAKGSRQAGSDLHRLLGLSLAIDLLSREHATSPPACSTM